MDKKTQEVLRKIGASIPHELLRKGLVKQNIDGGEKSARELLRSRNVAPDDKENIRKALESGQFKSKEVQEIDTKTNQEIEKFISTRVDKAIKSGVIKEAKEDEFIKKLRAK